MNLFIDRLLSRYDGTDWLLQRKARILFVLDLVLILAYVVDGTLSSIFLGRLAPEVLTNAFVVAGLILIFVPFIRGYYDQAAVLGIIIVLLGVTWTRIAITGQYFSDPSYDFLQYTLDIVLVLFCSNLIASRSRLIIATLVTCILLLGTYWYLLASHFRFVIPPNSLSVMATCFFFLLIAGVIALFTFQQNDRAIEIATQESLASQKSEQMYRESEERFRVIFECSRDAINVSRKGMQVFANHAFLKLYGFDSVDELTGTSILDHIAPSHRDQIEEYVRRRGAGEEAPSSYETVAMKKDGTEFDEEVNVSTYNLKGEIYTVAILRDITDRKQAENSLRESEARFRQLSDAALEGIAISNNAIFVDGNKRLTTMLGYELAEMVGKPILEFVAPESRASVQENMAANYEMKYEHFLLRKDGSRIPVESHARTIIWNGMPMRVTALLDISERKRAEAAAQESESRYLEMISSMPLGYYRSTHEGRFVEVNPAFCRMVGYSKEELLAMDIPGTLYFAEAEREEPTRLGGFPSTTETYRLKKKDGSKVWIEDYGRHISDGSGGIAFHEGLCTDVTYQKSLQEQLLQSQKLESIGQLAGGVAHDYNNILGVVIGYAQMLKSKLKEPDESSRSIDGILAAASRGADLSRQLLAFARKEIISPRVINANSSIESIEKMIRRIIGENLKFVFVPAKDLWNIRIDPSQFDQLLINLAANSKDAIKGTGTITVKTANVSLDENELRSHLDIKSGDYVKLTFQDTGVGIDGSTIKKIFEPFFTTKPKGQGTGLGLSTVYGIVKQNNGDISVSSNLGEGTTFEIFLPRSLSEVETEKDQLSEESIRGTETILVVEDQADMLEIAKMTLEKYGYKVLTAGEPGEALLLAEAYPQTIHLLVTDVIMPTMNGRELSDKMAEFKPGIETLFMSGYTANELAPQGILNGTVQFIQKPFTPYAFAKKVREALTMKLGRN